MDPFCIIIDTREKNPYNFKIINPPIETKFAGLKTGDYSLAGFEDQVCIERKSKADLFQSCGKGRDRLEREFQRMSKFRRAHFLVEASIESIYKHPPTKSQIKSKNVMRTVVAFCSRYGVLPWFIDQRPVAEKYVHILLDRFYRDIKDGKL